MATYRPGKKRDTFQSRCIGKFDREIVECIGDRVSINGGEPVHVYFDREFDKYAEGNVSVKTSNIEMCYLSCDVPNPLKRGDEVIRNSARFALKTEPEDQFDGWHCVELTFCGYC